MILKLWNSYSRYLKVSGKYSYLALTFGVIGAFLETISIYLLANIITKIENQSLRTGLIFHNFNFSKEIYLFIFISIALTSAIFYYLSNKNIVRAKCFIERFIREEITNITLNIKWEYYLKLSQGDIAKSIISEGQNISEGYMYFLQSLNYALIALIYFFICLFLVPDTFFILLLYCFFAFRIYIYYSNKAAKYGENLSQITSSIGNWTSSIFNNLKYIRTISKDKLAEKESKKIFLKFSDSYFNAMVASYKSKLVTEILSIIFIFLSINYIIFNNSGASNLILSLSLFIRMAPKVYNAQTRILDSIALISWPKMHIKKINWARKYREEFKNIKSDFIFNGNIIFDSVCFNYPDSISIFNNLNLIINQNDSIGIIGNSGSGKSTFLDLLSGIIRPKKGNIYICGENLKSLNVYKWREQFGIVMQDNFFKNDTLISNIGLGEEFINEDLVRNCLIKANAWEFVQNLPNKINENIYDNGMRFSGGERKKIALARALYKNPRVLVLDEPSAGLDEKSEKEFINVIKTLMGKMIIIIISHKKDVVQICDRVLILENKKLININEKI
tara:strand:- start:188 stop:1873 length:1686 start_codon:yes stop_codon:yes gene_type:complete